MSIPAPWENAPLGGGWVPRAVSQRRNSPFQKPALIFLTSIIEGANIPVAIYSLDEDPDPDDRYKCGVAGGCPWAFNPDTDLEIYLTEVIPVTPVESCSEKTDCASTEICGASFRGRIPSYGVCGAFTGYASHVYVACPAQPARHSFAKTTMMSFHAWENTFGLGTTSPREQRFADAPTGSRLESTRPHVFLAERLTRSGKISPFLFSNF